MRAFRTALHGVLLAALLAACVPAPQAPPPGTAAPAPAAPDPVPPAVSAPKPPEPWARARTPLEAYKQEVAQRVMVANATHGFEGVAPHFLRAVIVVQMSVDRSGKIASARILRSPGNPALEQLTLASLKRAEPLAAPPHVLLVGNRVEFTESFLFRDDSKFQIRSLAAPQPSPEPDSPTAKK
jgi:protein TonB